MKQRDRKHKDRYGKPGKDRHGKDRHGRPRQAGSGTSPDPPVGFLTQLARFSQDFTAGLNRRAVERMFDEDATRAIQVLAGDPQVEKPTLGHLVQQMRDFLLGLAFKLSPARRLLFAFSMVCPIFSLLTFQGTIGPFKVTLDVSPFFFFLSTAGLTLLLALELVDQLAVRDELEVARELQRELLPRAAPDLPGFAIAHSYRTANAIGGDYYDFLVQSDGRVVFTVGDASGHGMAAGLLMAISTASLKTALEINPDPLAVLDLLNRTLCRTGGKRAFMSLFFSVLDPQTGKLEYACAGHPFPFLRRADGEILELGQGALPLGVRLDVKFEREEITLQPGDLLLLYSDGLPESIGGPHQEAFGFDRLKGLLKLQGEPQVVHDRILAAVDGYLGEGSLHDDLSLVVLSLLPQLPTPDAPAS